MARVLALGGALLALGLAACGPSEEEQRAAAREEAWANLTERQEELRSKRAELADLREQIAAGAEALTVEEGESAEEVLAEIESEASALEEEVTQLADTFVADLVNYINEDPMIQGEEPTEQQRAAFRMKSEEDVILAQEYIEKGGDYRRAVDILERALSVDPGNEELEAELEKAREMRFVTEERFAQLKKGLTQPEVRDLLGTVFHRNIREYEEQGALAWFYPKEEGGAAAVFFRERDGKWVVYQFDFEAVDLEGNS